MSSDRRERRFWSVLMGLHSGSDPASLSPPATPLTLAPRIQRLGGTYAFVNTSMVDGTVVGVFWAASESAIVRVLEGTQPGFLKPTTG
jgi:hypothetical protein